MKLFRDFYGNTASIRTFKDGSAKLTIRSGSNLVKAQDYTSEKGARIALGRYGEGDFTERR